MKSSRIIIFATIIAICLTAIGVALYMQLTENDYNKAVKKSSTSSNYDSSTDEYMLLKNGFDNIFKNELVGEYEETNKKYDENDLVYISAEKVEMIPQKYDLDVQIPQININNIDIDKCNNDIKKTFQNKAANILANTEEFTVYNVKYVAYINKDILSLVVKANLKEGSKPERKIVKSYNYDLKENKLLEINDLIQKQNIGKNELQEKISEEIKKQTNYEQSLTDMGYEVYSRDINNEIYKVDNINNFFIGNEGRIYILFAYGNNNYTSEMDIIII